MKKIFLMIMLIVLISLFSLNVLANDEISVYLDCVKIEFDVKPQSINGRTMVPIRAIFEKMGAVVNWDAKTNTAVCVKNDSTVKMTVGSMDMLVNEKLEPMDVAPVVINGRTLAPTRYVAEAFGATVNWDQENNAVLIFSKGVSPQKIVTLYANDGRTIKVFESKIDAYINVGWHKTLAETQQIMYATDGRKITVFKAQVPDYEKVGWYKTIAETQQIMYAADGRKITVFKAQVPDYEKAGWYKTIAETQQTMYATDGRKTTVFKAQVPAYKQVGWYETYEEAQKVSKTAYEAQFSNEYYYRTPTGKKYHKEAECGGKNSYRTNDITGLTACSKCAQ